MEEIEGVMTFEVICISLGFIHGTLVAGCGWMLKAHQCPRMVGISQCCLKGIMGCSNVTITDQLWLALGHNTTTPECPSKLSPHPNLDLIKF